MWVSITLQPCFLPDFKTSKRLKMTFVKKNHEAAKVGWHKRPQLVTDTHPYVSSTAIHSCGSLDRRQRRHKDCYHYTSDMFCLMYGETQTGTWSPCLRKVQKRFGQALFSAATLKFPTIGTMSSGETPPKHVEFYSRLPLRLEEVTWRPT